MSNTLEDRLRANSNAFDGLLSLIPAKYYYDEKTQDQWKAKKKSKSQTKKDKKKKLDPDQQEEEAGTALHILKKRESVAKPVVLPGEKFKKMKQMQEQEEEEGEEEESEASEEEVEVNAEEESSSDAENTNTLYDDDGNEIEDDDVDEQESTNELKNIQKKKNLEELRFKLQSKIQNMKEKRKALGTKVVGAPLSREAILAQRKQKEDLKKKRKEEHIDVNNSESSDSELEDEIITLKQKNNNDDLSKDIMFQNIIFDDGTRATSDLQNIRKAHKKVGPSKGDIKSHLKLMETKKAKLESKDELDQIKYKQKEKWQRAMLQAEGVKMKDDERLLRKALKRKEAVKRKSAVEWDERKRAVKTTIAERAKRREENLQIRKDNKGKKRSKQQKMKRKYTGTASKVPAKKQKRAGFEGNLNSGNKK